jgi:FecR protein
MTARIVRLTHTVTLMTNGWREVGQRCIRGTTPATQTFSRRAFMMDARRTAGLLVLLVIASPCDAQEPSPVGRIKLASGSALIVRTGSQLPAKAGDVLFEADTLRTGADGRLGVTLKDETRISLAPNSEVRLDKFLYAPSEGHLAFTLRVVRGMAAYVSGRIARLAPDAVRLETPTAIVGVRGTRLAIRVETP